MRPPGGSGRAGSSRRPYAFQHYAKRSMLGRHENPRLDDTNHYVSRWRDTRTDVLKTDIVTSRYFTFRGRNRSTFVRWTNLITFLEGPNKGSDVLRHQNERSARIGHHDMRLATHLLSSDKARQPSARSLKEHIHRRRARGRTSGYPTQGHSSFRATGFFTSKCRRSQ